MVMPLALLAALVQAAPPAVVEELTRIERELAATWKNGNCAAWGAMLSDDWSVIHVSGDVISKAQALAMCKAPPVTFASLEASELSIRVFGDAAVVTGRTTATLTAPEPAAIVVRFTDVFVRRNNRWLVVASQATTLPARSPAARERRVTISDLANSRRNEWAES